MSTRSLGGVDYERSTVASATPVTPTGGSFRNLQSITALAVAATLAAPSGTPVDGNTLLIRIKDNGSARVLTWNAAYRVVSNVALPVTTVAGKNHYIGCVYNATDSVWDVLSVAVQP